MRKILWLPVLAALVAGCAESNLLRGSAVDATPPTVTATEPANSAENVGEARISITFSEPMSTNSVTLQSTPNLEWGTGTWSNGDRTLTFIPADVRPNTAYTITILGRDRAGNVMTQSFTLRFRTGSVVQAGVLAGSLVQNLVDAASDERVYAAFVAFVVAGSEKVLQAMPEEQRKLRETVAESAPEAARKVRDYFASHQVTTGQLAEYALRLSPDLRLVTAQAPAFPGGATPAPAAGAPAGSPASGATPPGSQARPGTSPAATPSPAVTPPAAATPAVAATPSEAVRRLQGLDALLRELYEGAKGKDLWQKTKADHDRLAAEYKAGMSDRARQAVTYLRVQNLPISRLVVVPNLLAARDSLEEVRVNGVLYVVVGPSAGPNFRGITQSLVRAVVTPVVSGHSGLADRSKSLFDLVKDEGEARGWTSWEEIVRESLVRAIDARLMIPNPDEQTQYTDTVFAQGLILVRHFAQKLQGLEKAETSLAGAVQDALNTVNVEQIRQQWANRRR